MKLPIGTQIVAIVFGLVTCSASCRSAELTASEIMDKCNEAMKPPIQFRVSQQGIDSILSQKILPDGTIATRTESIILGVRRITLQSEKENYEWYPDKKVCIDTQIVRELIKAKATEMFAFMPKAQPHHTQVVLVGTEIRDGTKCYIIKESMTPDFLAEFLKRVPPGGIKGVAPKDLGDMGKRLVVNSKDFTIESIAYRDNTTHISHMIQKAQLDPVLFLPPNGYTMVRPKTMQEYGAAMRQNLLEPLMAQTTHQRGEMHGPDQYDPKTGERLLTVPPGMTRKQYEQMMKRGIDDLRSGKTTLEEDREAIRKEHEKIYAENSTGLLPSTTTPQEGETATKKLVFLTFVLLVIGAATYYLRQHRMKKK